MTSRLERLFILLESGSSGVTRRAAAKQIGEVQKLHPHELHNLLNKLIVYIQSSFWDTRIAAAQAVEAILNNVPQWDPIPLDIKNEENIVSLQNENGRLSFKNFNLETVLSKGAHLMGSEGTEFDYQDESKGDTRERLIKQKAILDDKLGIQQANKMGIQLDDILSLEDMKYEQNGSNQSDTRLMPVEDVLKLDSGNSSKSSQLLSCREKNRAKRKARQSNQVNVISTSTLSRKNSFNESDVEPDLKKPKIEIKAESSTTVSFANDPVPDSTGSWSEAIDWPFESFCSKLYIDLFSPRWETRHGAATVLRELMKSHSSGAGKKFNMTNDEMTIYHEQWLEDAALRLLCVLALDRFGDFISDQVVAPVRETCAQVLGIVFKQMSKDNVCKTVEILLKLIKHDDWEVRHGGLLGIKYMLVVREDLLQMFLPLVVNDIILGLFDSVDDVGAVAASTLIPIASWLPKFLNATEVSNIVKMLWDLLLDQDELTSACNNFMGLLAAILSLPNASQWIQMEPMSTLIPRLWPFISHNTSSVRKSTLQTLKTLTLNMINTNNDFNISQNIENLTIANNELANKIKHIDTKNMQIHFGVKCWPEDLLREALRHIYQRILVEPIIEIQVLIEDVWQNLIINADLSILLHATCPYIAPWLCLAMQPSKLAYDPSLLVDTKKPIIKERKNKFCDLGSSDCPLLNQRLYLGGNETIPMDIREKNVTRARYKASKMLGLLSQFLVRPAPGVVYTADVESPIDCYTKVLVGYLQSKSALQRLISSMVISFWAISDISIIQWPEQLQERIKYSLMEHVYYDEVGLSFTRLLQESRDFIATLKQYKIPIADLDNIKVLTLDQIKSLCSLDINNYKKQYVLKPKISDLLEDRRKSLQNLFLQTSHEQNSLNITTQAVIAGALICMQCLPERLNPVIKPLMESIKHEECEMLQQLSAEFLVKLLGLVIKRNPSPNNKIITNLCTFLKSDNDFTPLINSLYKDIQEFDAKDASNANPYHGILTLLHQQKMTGQRDGMYKGPGRPPTIETTELETNESEDPFKKQNRIQRIGSTYVINAICYNFKETLFDNFPIIWNIMYDTILSIIPDDSHDDNLKNVINTDETNNLMTSLQLIEIAVPNIHNTLNEKIFIMFPKLCCLLYHPLKAIRHMVARSIATITLKNTKNSMELIIDKVVPLLSMIENVIKRQGAAETLARIVDKLQYEIVPYLVLLIIPLLGRMSDPNEEVRLLCTNCFATLIQLMPLDGAIPELYQLSDELKERKKKDREFLNYLFTPKSIPDFIVPIKINAELRTYQQAGINWLWFLNKYKLHGILCDDMGLGKTLQAICLLAGDHYQRNVENLINLPSLVICPPTLTGHWIYEINKFLPQKFLKPLHYVGLRVDRERLRHLLSNYNILVASYDIVRKDIDFFGSVNWNYCVLDEGHIIKNGKTKSSKAIKKLIANHRLILSGTPIQNNVLELWSLFDFLMPGFLGTEKQFMCKYSRPILASRDPKSSLKEQEAGALAMEALHRQVLPFLLRRVKEDVLTDLPPKITQDLLCELSPLQERLYEDFSKTHLKSEIKDCLKNIEGPSVHKETHVFQALRYLQNVCNHPKLILNAHHPEYNAILIELAKENKSLNDIDHSAKLPVLKQLLIDCNIGNEDASVNQHRALIFCQLKAMLDIIENDLLKKHLPAVSYLRLDGSIPAGLRHHTVTQFNNDPSIDVLLLTTQVGGLGLNLTGADTVIFVEHDWNPMKDLQAMDRAHRIGQKKVVNVYRLITKNSLEEKIMGLQKFKLLTANTVVSEKNSSMETMGTDQLLDLFDFSNQCNNTKSDKETKNLLNHNNNNNSNSTTMKQVLQNLPELWEDKQYEEEYDLTQFLQKLKK